MKNELDRATLTDVRGGAAAARKPLWRKFDAGYRPCETGVAYPEYERYLQAKQQAR